MSPLRIAARLLTPLLVAFAAAVALPDRASAQRIDQGAWFAFAGQGALDRIVPSGSRWRWWYDGHARFFNDSNGFETSIVRPGVGYELSARAVAWLGYAWIRNDPIPDHFDEQRVWQQLTWGDRFSGAALS